MNVYRYCTRAWNSLRCRGSYALGICGIHIVRHMPTFVSVEPANFCQLSCPECPVGMRRSKSDSMTGRVEPILGFTPVNQGLLTVDNFRRIVAQIAPYAHTVQLFWQGEPLLNDALPEMIHIAREAGLYTIVSTNAQRLDQSMAEAIVRAGLNRIIVSMDGWTQQTYEQYRQGGDVEKVKAAVRCLRKAKNQSGSCVTIELQCLYLKTNEAEWGVFRKEYKSLGADRLTMKTAQLYDYKHDSPLMPADTRYARYRYDAKLGEFVPKRKFRNRCFRLWSGCVIDVQGNILPCCYDKNKQYVFGNILHQPLRDIWHSEAAERFRRHVLRERKQIPICTNCDE
ncbi:MAG: SPASM domain-containing protein [Paludibacteraceae bacterium]|nr:SPASM domain-containing protein [Paludibacteraceae bacterium]